jgi:ATP-dependent RNA helicase DeaD
VIKTISDALEQQGYHSLTPVQEAVTDPALGNADLLVSAQTGSGKTVGFGLAIAPTLLGEAERFGAAGKPLAVVIAPTRELALQVKRELAWLFAKTGAIVASCVGGMDMRDERRALDRGAHIVVATPGRMRDHISRGSLDMTGLKAVVLDEADEMLDLGFREDLEFILGESPEDRRTLMFSATVPHAIANLARSYQKDAVRVQTVAEKSQHSDIEYRALSVSPQDAENALINVLRYYEATNAIVFCNTRIMVNRLTTRFSNRGFAVVALSGELSQNERAHALQSMRDGRARVCVATDVAARGIDLPNLELVIHAELPNNSDTLLHRSGRTGRAGRKGISTLIVPHRFRKKAERLLQMGKISATWANPPSADEVIARDEERLLGDPAWLEPITEGERDFVTKLTAQFDPDQIAAAYLRLYQSKQSAPEELAAAGAVPEPRQHREFGPSTWFSLSLGRNQNAEPRWILPLLCRVGGLSKDDIGAIRLRDDFSYVEIKQSSVKDFLAEVGSDLKLEDGAVLTQLDAAPQDAGFSPRPPASSAPRAPRPPRPDAKPAHRGQSDHKPRSSYNPDGPDASKDDGAPSAVWAEVPAIQAAGSEQGSPKPYIGKPYSGKSDAGKSDAVKPYAGKSGAVKPYAGKSEGGKPYAGKSDGGKPYAGKSGGGKPYAGKSEGGKPYAGKSEGGKPYAGKSEGGKPYAGKPGGSKPYAGKSDGGKPAGARFAGNASDPSKPFHPTGRPVGRKKPTGGDAAGGPVRSGPKSGKPGGGKPSRAFNPKPPSRG